MQYNMAMLILNYIKELHKELKNNSIFMHIHRYKDTISVAYNLY